MSTWAVRYVRLGSGPARAAALASLTSSASLERLLGASPEIVDDGRSPFVACPVASPSFQPDDLSALSRELGEAIAIAVQTVADLVIYDHFAAGARVRGLTYAGEAGWVRVVGEPEPWEGKALFSAVRLAELSEELEEEIEGELLEREKAELERLWAGGRLVEGSTRPPADPSALSRAIEKHFGLPPRPTGSAPRSSRLP